MTSKSFSLDFELSKQPAFRKKCIVSQITNPLAPEGTILPTSSGEYRRGRGASLLVPETTPASRTGVVTPGEKRERWLQVFYQSPLKRVQVIPSKVQAEHSFSEAQRPWQPDGEVASVETKMPPPTLLTPDRPTSIRRGTDV